MSFEEEFDKIIRRKAEEEKYPFDEGNWEKTSMLLDAERKAERMLLLKKLYLPAVLLLGIGISGILTYTYFNADAGHVSASLVTTEHLIADKGFEKNSEPSLNLKPDTRELSHSNSTNETSAPKTNLETLQPVNPASADNADRVTSPTHASPLKNTADQNNASSFQPSAAADNANTKDNNGNLNEDRGNSGFQSSPAVSSLTKETTPSLANPDNGRDNSLIEAEKESLAKNSETPEILMAEQLGNISSILPYDLNDPAIRVTDFSVLDRYDEDYYKNRPKKTHYLNLEAGANYMLGWNSKAGTDGKGLNWYGGINYGFYLSKKMTLGLGLQAYNLSHITQPFYTNSKKEYDFGSVTHYTVISTNDLYYLSVPLKLSYVINSSNSVGLGLNAGYLVSAKNTVETYSFQQEIGQSPVNREHNTGIYKGLNTTNLMLSLHYTTKLTKRFGVNAEFNYGLSDIFENKGTVNSIEKPMGLKLSIQYFLFDK